MPAAPPGGRLLLAAVLLTALNLRAAIAAVGPVLEEVRADLGLSAAAAGLLTTLPVLCFAVLAPACAALGRRAGPGAAVLGSLVLLALAQGLRVLDGSPVLLTGTFLAGAAMTVGNVLLPAVVKGFGPRAGTVTGLYTAALVAGAAAGAAFTAPLAAVLGWRGALAAEGVLAVVAAAVWAAARGAVTTGPAPAAAVSDGSLWRSPVAWAVTAVQALHSTLYFSLTAWLPTLLADRAGTDAATGSVAASVYQVLGIAGSLLVPAVLARRRGQAGLALGVAALWAVPVAGLLVAPGAWPAWAAVGGLAQGAGIAFAVTLVVLRAADGAAAARLSGMSQLVGYGVGALGPVAGGALSEATGGWTVPLLLLLALGLGLAAAGTFAARPVEVR